MSKYTTEVRFICETFAGYESSPGYPLIDTVIEKSREKIFDFPFPIFDESYRPVLESSILKHFYLREIGTETVGEWKYELSVRMQEEMPVFNQLYTSEMTKYSPLFNQYSHTKHSGEGGSVEHGADSRTESHQESGTITGKTSDTENRNATDKRTTDRNFNSEETANRSLTGKDTSQGKETLSRNLTENRDTERSETKDTSTTESGTSKDTLNRSLTSDRTETTEDTMTRDLTSSGTETGTDTVTHNTTLSRTGTDNTDTTRTDDLTKTETVDNQTTTAVNGDNTITKNLQKADAYSDTPQGSLTNVQNLDYLTNYRQISDTGTDKTNVHSEENKREDLSTVTKNTGTETTASDRTLNLSDKTTGTDTTQHSLTKSGTEGGTQKTDKTVTIAQKDGGNQTTNGESNKTATSKDTLSGTETTDITQGGTQETDTTQTLNRTENTDDSRNRTDTDQTVDTNLSESDTSRAGTSETKDKRDGQSSAMGTNDRTIRTTQDWAVTTIGIQGMTYTQIMTEFIQSFRTIDQMLFDRLEECFMQIW